MKAKDRTARTAEIIYRGDSHSVVCDGTSHIHIPEGARPWVQGQCSCVDEEPLGSEAVVADFKIRKLIEAAREIRDELEDRYDGAPDSPRKWMGIHILDLDAAIAAVEAEDQERRTA